MLSLLTAGIAVERATPDDVISVARIFRESRAHAMPYLPVLHSAEEDLVFFQSDVFPHARIWVARNDSGICGFVAVHDAWVNHLYVLPGSERRGIGRALMHHAMSAAEFLQLWVFQRNTAALAFYDRLGFRPIRRTDGSANEEREPDVLLQWSKGLEIARAGGPTDDVRALIGELDRELGAHYAPEQQHGLTIDAVFEPHIRFFVARLGGEAVGCGGVALFPDFAELKRMYVRPAVRGRGVADALVAKLTAEAAVVGRRVLRLQTGTEQHAAMRFYLRHGFAECEAFEPYTSMPPESIVASVFMEKSL